MKPFSFQKRHAAAVVTIALAVFPISAVLLTAEGTRARAETGTPVVPAASASLTATASPTPSATASIEPGATPSAGSAQRGSVSRHAKFEPAADAFRSATFQAGQPITTGGLFSVDIATGVIENWVLAGRSVGGSPAVFYQVSDDSRYVVAPQDGYILDRETGLGFSWRPEAVTYVTAWRDRVLFLDGQTLLLLDNEMRKVHAFAPAAGLALNSFVPLVSPDGAKLAFVAEGGGLAIVDLTAPSPAFRVVSPSPARRPDGPGLVSSLQPTANGREIVLVSQPFPDVAPTVPTTVRRYDWDGRMLSELSLPKASDVRLSPDGAVMAWETTLRDDGFNDVSGPVRNWPAVVVGDAKGNPLFRIKGASFCHGAEQGRADGPLISQVWVADSSGIVVKTRDGAALMSIRDRSLQTFRLGSLPSPAPDRVNLFAFDRIRAAGLDGAFVTQPPVLPFSASPYVTPWGAGSNELRFASPAYDGNAPVACTIGAGGSPVVETPPFSGSVTRMKVVAQGDCLNLRLLPSQTASAITCVKDGALLEIAAASFSPFQEDFISVAPAGASLFLCGAGGGGAGALVTAYGGWVHVRTVSGIEGWVSNQYVDWAE